MLEVLKYAYANDLHVFLGLLDNPPTSAPESSICYEQYATIQGEVAGYLAYLIANSLSNNFTYDWYISQEPFLDMIAYNSSDFEILCNSDNETRYFITATDKIYNSVPIGKGILFSPFWYNNTNPKNISENLCDFLSCVPLLTIAAPQDGVGTFNRSISTVSEFFAGFKAYIPSGQKLWANTETYLPYAKFCETAPASRIKEQVQAEAPHIEKSVNFWSYNLPGAPTNCTNPKPKLL